MKSYTLTQISGTDFTVSLDGTPLTVTEFENVFYSAGEAQLISGADASGFTIWDSDQKDGNSISSTAEIVSATPYNAAWADIESGATSNVFTSVEEADGIGLTKFQLSELMGKVKEAGGGKLADTTTFWGQTVNNGAVSGNIALGTATMNTPKTVSANNGKVQVIFGHDNPDNGYEYVQMKATNNLTSKTATLEVMAENDAYISSNAELHMGSKQIKNLADGTANTDAVNKGQMEDRILAGGTSAPTTSTAGKVGTLYAYVESGTGHLAICTAVSGTTYTWQTLI